MDRRGFLGRIGAATAGIALLGTPKAKAARRDDFEHKGYRVKWRDYQTQANQNIITGMWLAKHGTQDLQWASTTLGQCYPTRDWEVIDMTRANGWPMLTVFSADADKAATKQRALDALMDAMDGRGGVEEEVRVEATRREPQFPAYFRDLPAESWR